MTSIIRVAAVVNRVLPADAKGCMEALWQSVEELGDQSPDIILFPCLSLSGADCGSFFGSNALLESCRVALERLCIVSAALPCYLVVGLPLEDVGRGISAMAVLYSGAVRGIVPAFDPPAQLAVQGFSQQLLPPETVFRCGSLGFSVLAGDLSALPRRMHLLQESGCDLVLVPSAQPATAGSFTAGCGTAAAVSRDYGIAVAVANAGVGEISSPRAYRGWCGLWECGRPLSVTRSDQGKPVVAVGDLDADVIRSLKSSGGFREPVYTAYPRSKSGLLRPIGKDPFGESLTESDLLDLFSLQVHSLACRMQNTGIQRLIIGVSGGLDSTLAMLVAAEALDELNLPAANLLGVTMPGFGTSDRTYQNALELIGQLGARLREIPIREACSQHYRDIGLDENDKNAAYENAQARERTQILMDLGNLENALVVGTGDLSEAALGWCTYGGDHLAGYNVNICLTKGLVRRVCYTLAQLSVTDHRWRQLLEDILDTPVSPELLPPGAGGQITQKSEDILGPYQLHDFFLYYLVQYSMRLTKIYHYACIAFSGCYEADYILDRLRFFVRRFCQSQFKRSCQTDAAAILLPNLTLDGFSFPSDIGPGGILAQLEEL